MVLPYKRKDVKVTQRELDVLKLVFQGKSNKAIGAELGISPLTVKNHIAKLGLKLRGGKGTGGRIRTCYNALCLGLISPPARVLDITKPLPYERPKLEEIEDKAVVVNPRDWIRFGNTAISPSWRTVLIDDQEIRVTPVDFNVLMAFMSVPLGKVIPKQELIDMVFGKNRFVAEQALVVRIKLIRELLRQQQSSLSIVTIQGVGYKSELNKTLALTAEGQL